MVAYDSDGWKLDDFYHQKDGDRIWWTERIKRLPDGSVDSVLGEHLFSFDQKKIYNLFQDYPRALTQEEREIFDKENPFWAEFFADRL